MAPADIDAIVRDFHDRMQAIVDDPRSAVKSITFTSAKSSVTITKSVNRGWTIHGKAYHRVERIGTRGFAPVGRCRELVGMIDQTTLNFVGEPTGALVPTNLHPCKRCFPNGDA